MSVTVVEAGGEIESVPVGTCDASDQDVNVLCEGDIPLGEIP